MSREAYLFFDAREPAGVVWDWPEFCGWAREHGPLGPALETLFEEDEAVPAADVERDLIACFQRATAWPISAEEFLEAVLCRLWEDRTIGFEETEPPGEDDDGYFRADRLIERLFRARDETKQHWQARKTRAALLLRIAQLIEERRDDDWEDNPPRDPNERDSELAVAVSMLGQLSPPPRRKSRKR